MKTKLILIISVLAFSANAYSQKRVGTSAAAKPATASPAEPILPSGPLTIGATESLTVRDLPTIHQGEVFNRLTMALDGMQVREGNACTFKTGPRAGHTQQYSKYSDHPPLALGEPCSDGKGSTGTVVFASNGIPVEPRGPMYNNLREAQANFEKISSTQEAVLPKLLLWTLKGDAQLVQHYSNTGEEKYALAAFSHLRSLALSQDTGKEASVTVVTVDEQGKRQDGFQICYLPADWVGLGIEPFAFPDPSGSSQKLPRTKWAFWSRDFVDRTKVGVTTPVNINKDQSLSIGIPR